MRRIAMFAGILPTLAAVMVGTAVAVPNASASPASRPNPAAIPRAATTLEWIDANTGAVTRTWTGSPEQAAAIRRGAAAPAGTRAGRNNAGTVQPDLRRLSCTDPNPYWDIRNYPPLLCFADAGDLNVAIYSVYEVDSGNNTGSVTWWYNGYGHLLKLGRWTSAIFSARVFVSHIHIN
jgi:hypothetical protein